MKLNNLQELKPEMITSGPVKENIARMTSLTLTPLKIQEITRNSCINHKTIRRNKMFAVVFNYADHKLYLIKTEVKKHLNTRRLTIKGTDGQILHDEISFDCFNQEQLCMNSKSTELFNKIGAYRT